MTTISESIKDNTYELILDGHANYDKEGRDIVCAAISILAFSLLDTLREAHENKKVEALICTFKEGYIRICCKVTDKSMYEAIKVAHKGFVRLAENYEKYVIYSPKGNA